MHIPVDSSLGLQTPEGIEIILYPAGLLIRSCAYAIDVSIQGAFVILLVTGAGMLGQALGLWFFMILLFGVNWFYHVLFEIFFKGQSPGKRILGLRVVQRDGSPVGPGASFLRNLLRFADTFMFLYLIALLLITLSPGFRRLGDWAADTLVVYTAQPPANFAGPGPNFAGHRPTPVMAGEAVRDTGAAESIAGLTVPVSGVTVPVTGLTVPVTLEEKQVILMFARRYPLLAPARADEIAHAYAASLREKTGASSLSDSEYLLAVARKLRGETR